MKNEDFIYFLEKEITKGELQNSEFRLWLDLAKVNNNFTAFQLDYFQWQYDHSEASLEYSIKVLEFIKTNQNELN
jgi:hypothetical protein